MEETKAKCNFCGINYKPKRRFVQRFCSDSCRSLNHIKNKNQSELSVPNNPTKTNNPIQVDKMSIAGVGNAVAGALAVNFATNIFTKEENKPATKKDIKEIKSLLMTRYHSIKNVPPRPDGARPFYDLQTQSLVYLKKQ
ncbi:hypothetical protein [Flavobacterium sp. W20_MBD1_R3]|uniref:hypothetical protein n=1 Tax=Flavobacterium sp. W20_MBD1_R3 TaxID=3240278 RepID=UPI003F8F6B44